MLEYIVKSCDETYPEDAKKFNGVMDDADDLAEEAAEDFHDMHDGWEADWPATIEVFRDGKSLGTFIVECEQVQRFHARK